MNAIVAAGGRPAPKEPLYPYTKGNYKALLDIAGKPMIQWILDALSGSTMIDAVIVTGLPLTTHLEFPRPITLLESHHDIFQDIRSGVTRLQEMGILTEHTLLVSSDVPTITPQIVDWLITTVQQTDHDFYYPIVERSKMEARFPKSNRTYIHLKDMEVCGGDMIAIRSAVAFRDNPTWTRLVEARKSPIKQASLLGIDTLFFILFHLLTIEKAEVLLSKRLRLKGRALLVPYAEIGMDVDKPHQLEAVREDFTKRK